jgi:hypothetical protein
MERLEASKALMLAALFADKGNTIVSRRRDARAKLARSFDPTNQTSHASSREPEKISLLWIPVDFCLASTIG